LGCFFSFLTVKENAGMPENYRLWIPRKKEGNLLAEICSLRKLPVPI
jgi:hypothetical protein